MENILHKNFKIPLFLDKKYTKKKKLYKNKYTKNSTQNIQKYTKIYKKYTKI